MDKCRYDFRIQSAEIDKEDIKYFKQWNHCRPVLLNNLKSSRHYNVCTVSAPRTQVCECFRIINEKWWLSYPHTLSASIASVCCDRKALMKINRLTVVFQAR
jgi:hypothetical protein